MLLHQNIYTPNPDGIISPENVIPISQYSKVVGVSGFSKGRPGLDDDYLIELTQNALRRNTAAGMAVITGTGLVPDAAHRFCEEHGIDHYTLVPECYAKYANKPEHKNLTVIGREPMEEVWYYVSLIDKLITIGGGDQTQYEISEAKRLEIEIEEVKL